MNNKITCNQNKTGITHMERLMFFILMFLVLILMVLVLILMESIILCLHFSTAYLKKKIVSFDNTQ